MAYKPNTPFSTAMELLIPTETKVKGVEKKTWPETGIRINGSFRTFVGSETVINDLYAVQDTAIIDTWYRPDIKSNCRIKVLQTGGIYEVFGNPENIEMRNQYMRIRVKKIDGGA